MLYLKVSNGFVPISDWKFCLTREASNDFKRKVVDCFGDVGPSVQFLKLTSLPRGELKEKIETIERPLVYLVRSFHDRLFVAVGIFSYSRKSRIKFKVLRLLVFDYNANWVL
jgi:hypothetical protein